jgi:hypothetical protein
MKVYASLFDHGNIFISKVEKAVRISKFYGTQKIVFPRNSQSSRSNTEKTENVVYGSFICKNLIYKGEANKLQRFLMIVVQKFGRLCP